MSPSPLTPSEERPEWSEVTIADLPMSSPARRYCEQNDLYTGKILVDHLVKHFENNQLDDWIRSREKGGGGIYTAEDAICFELIAVLEENTNITQHHNIIKELPYTFHRRNIVVSYGDFPQLPIRLRNLIAAVLEKDEEELDRKPVGEIADKIWHRKQLRDHPGIIEAFRLIGIRI